MLKMKILSAILFFAFLSSCAPPLEDKCFSSLMDQWESANIEKKDGQNFRFISIENSDGVLDDQYYPDTPEGKNLFDSYAWSKCTKN